MTAFQLDNLKSTLSADKLERVEKYPRSFGKFYYSLSGYQYHYRIQILQSLLQFFFITKCLFTPIETSGEVIILSGKLG